MEGMRGSRIMAVGRVTSPPNMLLVTLLVACGDARTPDSGFVTRDSVGITIVESSSELEARSLGWRVPGQPVLSIGVAEGDEPHQLFHANGAVELADGRIAVLNAGTQEIRYFDGQGRHLETRGGRGSGPGEFQFPQLVPPVGSAGELLIWDLMNNRFTLLDGRGGVLRTITPEAIVRTPAGWDAAGSVLAMRSSAAAGLDTPDGVMVNDVTYEALRLDGGEPVFIAELPARIYHAQIRGQPWFRSIPLDPRPSASAGGGLFYLTTGAAPEIQVFTSDGALVRLIRILRSPEPLGRAEFEAHVENELAGITDEDLAREWRNHYDRMPRPETAPVYNGLVVDDTNHLWAEHFRFAADGAPTWSVFDPDGRALGTIQTPEGITIHHIGEDFLIGHTSDEFGVERIVRFTLDRTSGAD